jgi:hypothetical protein
MFKYFILFSIIFCSFQSFAQDISELKNQKPFIIHGSVGGSANFYESNEETASRPPCSWNLHGNFTPTVYGIAMPLSFTVNQFGNSFSQPFSQFGISPQYKWAKLHLGVRSIRMSPLIFDGQSFRGAGLELNPKKIRFAAFYGKLNRKVNEDTTSGRYESPQYSRIGYGAKIGYGDFKNFIDLIYFHAQDDSNSAKILSNKKLASRENTVIGTSFKLTPVKQLSFSVDFSLSGLTQDLADTSAIIDSSGKFRKFIGNFMPLHETAIANYASQARLQVNLKNYNSVLGYRRVEPGFKSLGTPYMINDVELINWTNNVNTAKNLLNITTVISFQHNNLDKNLESRMNTLVGNLDINAMPKPTLNLHLNYSGYKLAQQDGTETFNDSVRLNQFIHNISFSPSFTIIKQLHSHTISGNINYMILDDKNPVTNPLTSSTNLAGSVNYTIGFTKKSLSVSVGGLFNNYKQDTISYSSYGATIASAAQLLKKKNLSLQGSVSYIMNNSSLGNAQSNLTFSLNAGLSEHRHSFNLFASYVYTPYNPINDAITKVLRQVVASKNLSAGISYNYSF